VWACVHHEDQHYAVRLLTTASPTDRGATVTVTSAWLLSGRRASPLPVVAAAGMKQREKRVAEMLFQITNAKPGLRASFAALVCTYMYREKG